ALRTFEKARALWEELVRRDPSARGFRSQLAITYLGIAILRGWDTGPPAERVRPAQISVELWQQLTEEDPGNPRYRAGLANSLGHLGMYLALAGALSRAEEVMEQTLVTAERLAADFPTVPAIQQLVDGAGGIRENVGSVWEHAGRWQEAESVYRRMVAGAESLHRAHPTVARYRMGAFHGRVEPGMLLWRGGRCGDA